MTYQQTLESVLESGALTCHFQPIFNVQAEPRLHGLECLIRGPRHAPFESAGALFAAARALGLEERLDRACVATALAEARSVPPEIELTLNVIAKTLASDLTFVPFLRTTAEPHGIDLSRVTIEIVPEGTFSTAKAFADALDALRALGVKISLDDIGLGSSTFRTILDVRPDYYKVDRYFVDGCATDGGRQAILEGIVLVARRLNGRVVAEGVEDGRDLSALESIGIVLAQGYLFSPAAPLEKLVEAGVLPRAQKTR